MGVVDASVALSWVLNCQRSPNQHQATKNYGAHRDAAIQRRMELLIEVDSETDACAWTNTLHLADLHRVTIYDAGHLELALRRNLPIARRDSALTAAGNAGVVLLPGL